MTFASLACGNVFLIFFSIFTERVTQESILNESTLDSTKEGTIEGTRRSLKEQVRAHRRPFDVLNAIFIKVSHAAQQICGKATFYLHFYPTPQYVKVTALNRKNDRPGDHGRLRRV